MKRICGKGLKLQLGCSPHRFPKGTQERMGDGVFDVGAFGRKGPEGALIPLGPRKESGPEDKARLLALEESLGFCGERAALREESDAEFARAAGKVDGTMDEELFIEGVTQLWSMDRRTAHACFFAGDSDGSGRINHLEYLMLREAFHHDLTGQPEHEAIYQLRFRAIWHCYDHNHDGTISRDELREWVRNLCAGDGHVEHVASSLFSHQWGADRLSLRLEDAMSLFRAGGSLHGRLLERGLLDDFNRSSDD